MLDIPGIKTDIILAPYTTYKIGGKADYFLVASRKEELISAIIEARGQRMPYFILGAGANILISDKGYRGLVIRNETKDLKFDKNILTVESGAMISDLIDLTSDKGLSGLEHFAGIPSTVGGAMWQNLHFLSPDRTRTLFISDIVGSAEVLDENSKISNVDKDFFKFGYDYSILHDRKLVVMEVSFQLDYKDSAEIKHQIEENLKWRNKKQPQLHQFPSCGSVFKKIDGIGAGRLIERAGLKGYNIGGAQISEKHANYIVNTGTATAENVVALIKVVQNKVKADTGYNLEPEISFIGEF